MADKHEINTIINVETKVKDRTSSRTLVGVQKQLEKLVTAVRTLGDDKMLRSLPKLLKDSAQSSDQFNTALKKVNTQLARTVSLSTKLGETKAINIHVGGGGRRVVRGAAAEAAQAAGTVATGGRRRTSVEREQERLKAEEEKEYQAAVKNATRLARAARIEAEKEYRKKDREKASAARKAALETERANKKIEREKASAEKKAALETERAGKKIEREKASAEKKAASEAEKAAKAALREKKKAENQALREKKKADEQALREKKKADKQALREKKRADDLAARQQAIAAKQAERATQKSALQQNLSKMLLLKSLPRGLLGLGFTGGLGRQTSLSQLLGVVSGIAPGMPGGTGGALGGLGGGLAASLYALGSLTRGVGGAAVGGATGGSQGLVSALSGAEGAGGAFLRPIGGLMRMHHGVMGSASDLREAVDQLYLANLIGESGVPAGTMGAATYDPLVRGETAEQARRAFEASTLPTATRGAAALGMSSTEYIQNQAAFMRRAGRGRLNFLGPGFRQPSPRAAARGPTLREAIEAGMVGLRLGYANPTLVDAAIDGSESRAFNVGAALSRATGISLESSAELFRAVRRRAVGEENLPRGYAAQMDTVVMKVFSQAIADGMSQAEVPELLEEMIGQFKRSGEMGIISRAAGAYTGTAAALTGGRALSAERAYGLTSALVNKGQSLAYGARSPMDLMFLRHFGGLDLGRPITPGAYNKALEQATRGDAFSQPAKLQNYLRHMMNMAGGAPDVAAGATAAALNASLGRNAVSVPEMVKLLTLVQQGGLTTEAIRGVVNVPSAAGIVAQGISDTSVTAAEQQNRMAAAGLPSIAAFQKLDESSVKLLEASKGIANVIEDFALISSSLNDILSDFARMSLPRNP